MIRTTATAVLALFAGSGVLAQDALIVSNTNDAGDGSLRAALSAAAAMDAPAMVVVTATGELTLENTLSYPGSAPLVIAGNGLRVTGGNFDLLAVTGGADLTVSDMTFAGPGGYSIDARGDVNGPAGKGIAVAVPANKAGTIDLTLNNVTVRDVAGHGVHVSDCTLADECGGGQGGAGAGSAAGIRVTLIGVTIDSVGNGRFDADGLRVDERGEGGIVLIAEGATFTGVGADGVELDEGQDGSVRVVATNSRFDSNGAYCDPAILSAFMPEVGEAEFEAGTTAADAIPGPITGSPDNRCFEREVDTYDDGSVEAYEFAIDVDDGFDIDEAGEGSIISTVIGGTISNNFDEGLDYDEEGPGGISTVLIDVTADGNIDDAYKHSEEGPGGVTGLVSSASASGNGGKGFVFEEEGQGDVSLRVVGATAIGNDDGDDTGVEAVQEDDGAGMISVTGGDIADGFDLDGVTM